MCLQCPSMHDSIDDTERIVEEVSDLLRMVCLTEDSAYLAKFLEEILELYIDSIPKTLGNLYHSLGFEIPQKLVGVLPTDFLSDDSMTQESKSPLLSEPHRSVSGATESEQLEELRTRSAKKRRKNALIRHKSIAEVSQNLRQIEIPKVSRRATKNGSSRPTLQQPPVPVKDTVQEVTKVRRNLFEEMSPSKRSVKRGLPRSHSVSTVEGLEYKLENCQRTKGYYHKLLTKSVAETPVHKQISRRLLHRQIKGRSSDPGPDVDAVEESPEKGDIGLRRSPRIKHLSFSRTNSGSFYSVSQQKSRSVQRVHSFQQEKSDQREHSPIQSIQSPKRLLFGAVSDVTSPSEKGSARNKRPSRNTVDSQMPTAYQTPKKCSWKSPSPSTATPRRFPCSPRTPSDTLETPHKSPAATTPTKQVLLESPEVSSSHDWNSPSPPKVTAEQGWCVPAGVASVLGKRPTTHRRPRGPSPGLVQNSSQPSSGNSSPENTSCLAAPMASTAQTSGECVTPARYSLRSPARAAALGKQSNSALVCLCPNQTHHHPHVPGASQAKELGQKWKGKAVKTPKKPGDTAVTLPVSSEEPFTSSLCDVSKSPLRNCSTEPCSPAEPDWEEPQNSSSVAPRLSCPAPSTPRKISQTANSDIIPPPPPSKFGKKQGKASNPESCFLEHPRLISVAARLGASDTPDAKKDQREVNASPQAPARHGDPGPGFRSDWHVASPSPVAGDMECLPLLEEAGRHGSDDVHIRVSPVGEGEGLGALVAYKQPSPANPGLPQSPPACGPSTPPTASYALRCTADRRQRKAAAQLRNLDASSQLSEAPGSLQTYEVELEMQASGLPKLKIKKRDTSSGSEAEPLSREASALPGLSVPRGSKAETAYVSPPCLHPSHSTPGKSSGQTYICQSCTPTHCPSSTPCPLQTDAGLPWTPSPKHSGKTTPDSIRDWPRRKRAVAAAGRGTVSTDLSSCVSPLPLEATERDLELGGSKTPILGDFELEGVCRLPDQSPPRDTLPEAEEAISSGQFGLGSRKRHLSAEEEAQSQAQSVCDKHREDSEVCTSEENSPSMKVQQRPPSPGDDRLFLSGSPPPSGCAVRGCLSASGLQALTQSPLLFHGKTPSSQARDAGVDVLPPAAEESPFRRTLSRSRAIGRTYTRKKLIT